MTPYSILYACDRIDKILEQQPGPGIEFATNIYNPTKTQAISHCKWMIEEIRSFVQDKKEDKAYRWLGFVQGVLWMTGLTNINTQRYINKGITEYSHVRI